MKKVIMGLVAAAVLGGSSGWAAPDVGSSFGTLATARSIGMGKASFTAALGVADATSAFGMVRYGFTDYLEGRVKLGIRDDGSTDAGVTIGADVTYQLWVAGPQSTYPIDLAFGGMVEYYSVQYNVPNYSASIWQVGGFALGSYAFLLENGMALSPYGRLNLRLEDISSESVTGDRTTELEFGLNGGVMFELSETLNVYGEFQFDGNNGGFIGLEFMLL